MTCWNAHLFYLHWLYTGDDAFMKTRAYPWSLEAAECVRALLSPDADGILLLPRSSAPEIGNNRYWPANTNYDLMSMKMHFLAVAEMAEAQGLEEEAQSWHETVAKLGDYHAAEDGELLICPGIPLREHHRHLRARPKTLPGFGRLRPHIAASSLLRVLRGEYASSAFLALRDPRSASGRRHGFRTCS